MGLEYDPFASPHYAVIVGKVDRVELVPADPGGVVKAGSDGKPYTTKAKDAHASVLLVTPSKKLYVQADPAMVKDLVVGKPYGVKLEGEIGDLKERGFPVKAIVYGKVLAFAPFVPGKPFNF